MRKIATILTAFDHAGRVARVFEFPAAGGGRLTIRRFKKLWRRLDPAVCRFQRHNIYEVSP